MITRGQGEGAWSAKEVHAFRSALKQLPLRGYDHINYANPGEHDLIAVLNGAPLRIFGFEFEVGRTFLSNDIEVTRSQRLMSAQWSPLEPFLVEHSKRGDARLLSFMCDHACEAVRVNSLSAQQIVEELNGGVNDDLAHSGVAVAHRYYKLAYLVAASSLSELVGAKQFEALCLGLLAHGSALEKEEIFLAHSNHGAFQALSQICGSSRMLELEKTAHSAIGTSFLLSFKQGNSRLRKVLGQICAADGILREHSLGYHLMVSRSANWASDQGLVQEANVKAMIAKMRDAEGWMIDPNGNSANLGDTDQSSGMARDEHAPFSDKEPEHKLFPDSGYWFVRGRTELGSTYLAQSCAFHSRVHKQADSGTFIWHDRGRDILIDAGRYGYAGRTTPGSALFKDGFWYSDPKRIYVESTRAHNTIEIDGKNHRRYRQTPTGGTITGALEQNGVFASRCVVPNAGPGQHQRFVITKPGEWLAVFDTCRFSYGPHTVRQWFQVHPDWSVEGQGDRWILRQDDQILSVLPVTSGVTPSAVASGQIHTAENEIDSGYLGWWSREAEIFERCTTICCSKSSNFETLATLFIFGDISASACKFVTNVTHRSIKLNWRNGKSGYALSLTSSGLANSEFLISYAKD